MAEQSLAAGDVSVHSHFCYWDWCREVFASQPEFQHHVIHEHVRKAKPIKKRDLHLLRKIEGKSIIPQHSDSHIQEYSPSFRESAPSLEYSRPATPSLPMVNHSTMLSFSPHTPSASEALQDNDFSPTSTSGSSDSRGHQSFAQLSSPLGTPPIPSLPPSPDFDVLVANAVQQSHASRYDGERLLKRDLSPGRKDKEQFTRPFKTLRKERSGSSDSSSARDAVEAQLSQNLDVAGIHKNGTINIEGGQGSRNILLQDSQIGQDVTSRPSVSAATLLPRQQSFSEADVEFQWRTGKGKLNLDEPITTAANASSKSRNPRYFLTDHRIPLSRYETSPRGQHPLPVINAESNSGMLPSYSSSSEPVKNSKTEGDGSASGDDAMQIDSDYKTIGSLPGLCGDFQRSAASSASHSQAYFDPMMLQTQAPYRSPSPMSQSQTQW